MTKYVYLFTEGNANMRELLGGKGANLAEMTNIGLPVPQGFTITTEACTKYYEDGRKIDESIKKEIEDYLRKLEEITGKKFGDKENPLLVSVRSGARSSMPGMMDSVHFVGMNDEIAEGLAKKTNNPRFAYDTYRRAMQTYTDIVEGFESIKFEKYFEVLKEELNVKNDTDLTVDNLKYIISKYKEEFKKNKGEEYPQNPIEQLLNAVHGVFESWNCDRAKAYRKLNEIPDSWGTAVNVQENVFGNMNDNSGTGVAFSRNPATGEKKLFGEYLINAQGDDVVAGLRTPSDIEHLKDQMPNCYNEFKKIVDILEKHYKDMMDMEFTIENGKLFMLQCRVGKRTTFAAINIACDLVKEGMITQEEALMKIEPKSLDQLLHPMFDKDALEKGEIIGSALPASPGAATGKVVFSSEDAKKYGKGGKNEKVILVRLETTPEDIEGMIASQGILTVRGGMTSHAAVVARGMGTCCVSGCEEIIINENEKFFKLGGYTFNEGDYISLDGSTGKIYKGEIKTVDASVTGNFGKIMDWADECKRLGVRTNADNPRDTKKAVELGAEGIGLCRTEHMFFEEERIPAIRKMILSETVEQREEALSKLIPFQKSDFKAMYKELKGLPMTVRYLDPPLHEFLPKEEADIRELAKEMGVTYERLVAKCDELHEFNPMMGHRGCRLAVTYPEIARMQTRALMEAAIEVKEEDGYDIVPEIMIPLVGEVKELKFVKDIVIEVAEQVKKEKNSNMEYHIGTMIEIPRAAITADKIAKEAEFFSFGTNDLTQMTFGFSRDDAGKFLKSYYERKIYEQDPFARIDQAGVGELVKMAVEKGKKTRPNIKLGICGEHGGDPSSVEFCHNIGLTYVSCSPFRVPIARLAAAQAAIKQGSKN